MNERIKKINSLLTHEIGSLFLTELSLKEGVFITVSKVRTTDDLTKSYISVKSLPITEESYVLKTLEHERASIQKKLHKKLHLKILPKISFVGDSTGEEADEIDHLLSKT